MKLFLIILMFVPVSILKAEQDNRFAYAQVRYSGSWDPYPDIYREILSFIITTTSIKVIPERKIVAIDSDEIFEYPFIIITGNGSFPDITLQTAERIKQYAEGGGVIFIENAAGVPGSSFERGARKQLKRIFPDNPLHIIPREHAVMRSFYLMRTVAGRKVIHNYLEGLEVDGRTCVIMSHNDALGAWARDRLGNYLYACEPGGENQRKESIKLTANIILFALTGTYKTDAIHIPFILQKLRSHPY